MSTPAALSDLRRRIELASGQSHPPGTAAERFRELLVRGVEALDGASYGIAAAYVVRDGGVELTFTGHNTIAGGDPAGHAEMNAIRAASTLVAVPAAQRAGALRRLEEQGTVTVRACPEGHRETVLYATLEPCPMCTVTTINAGIGRVVYAHDDPVAGALAEPRLRRLAPIWHELATTIGLRVVRCQSADDGDPESYVPGDVLELLDELFTVSREQLDARLASGGFFDPYPLTKISPGAPPS